MKIRSRRTAIRTLRRDATFAVFAILIVGLGIGASAAVFSVVNILFLRPLPFQKPGELVWIANVDATAVSGGTQAGHTQVGHLLDLVEVVRDATREASDRLQPLRMPRLFFGWRMRSSTRRRSVMSRPISNTLAICPVSSCSEHP